MPGKMVQCLKSVGTANPLVLIDEIDKVFDGLRSYYFSCMSMTMIDFFVLFHYLISLSDDHKEEFFSTGLLCFAWISSTNLMIEKIGY